MGPLRLGPCYRYVCLCRRISHMDCFLCVDALKKPLTKDEWELWPYNSSGTLIAQTQEERFYVFEHWDTLAFALCHTLKDSRTVESVKLVFDNSCKRVFEIVFVTWRILEDFKGKPLVRIPFRFCYRVMRGSFEAEFNGIDPQDYIQSDLNSAVITSIEVKGFQQ